VKEMQIAAEAEADLIRQVICGSHQLFHQLIRPYERRIYLMAFSVLKNEADAEDAVQDAVLKAYRNLHQFRADAKFSTWLTSITLNEARGRLRKMKGIQIESLDSAAEDRPISPAMLVDWREVPSEALERLEVKQMLVDAVAELPEIYREVFVARDIEGLDVSETAEVLEITVSSVKVRLHRARMMLQKRLAPMLKTAVRAPRRFPWF
jgi:RNA polymerase sigma-70 factor (ECF subfamily)